MKPKQELIVRVPKVLLLWVSIVALVACNSCGRADKTREVRELQAQAAEREWQSNVTAFAKKYNAIIDWKSALPKRGPFTADVSKVLIGSNKPPILLSVDLEDVSEKDGGYMARFSEDYSFSTNDGLRLLLKLKCSQAQADRLMGSRKFHFAVIAQIYEISGETYADEIGDTVMVKAFGAKGTCLDFIQGGKGTSILGVLDEGSDHQ
jgi:hypothetical protein